MKLKYFYTSVCIMLAGIFCANAQTVKNVTLTEAGTLSTKITESEQATLTELTVTGPLNGTDIALIRGAAPTLEKLNMKNASIVEGGSAYFVYEGKSYTTTNNVIGNYMFFAMSNLKTLILPSNVEEIGEFKSKNWSKYEFASSYSIARCSMLETVELPSTLYSIGGHAFSACARLASITIPEGVEIIGTYAFENCKNLKTVKFPSTFGIRNKTFEGAYNPDNEFQQALVYSDYVGYIFTNCTALTDVSIPEGVPSLTYGMFNGCAKLATVTLPSTLKTLNGAFNGCTGLVNIDLPTGLTGAGSFNGCEKLTKISIPDGVTECPSFANCTALTEIKLPTNITTIGYNAFAGCSSLTEISVPSAVTSIETSAFENCTSLVKVTLSAELTSIGEHAFGECDKLPSITIPNKVISLSDRAFRSCDALETVVLPRGLNSMGRECFYYCQKLTTINLPDNLFEIGNSAFGENIALESIQLPNNLTEIPSYMFDGCISLKNVTLPNSLIKIGSGAFRNCTPLSKITIPGSTQSIGSEAFANTSLTEVVLSNGLLSLGANAFSGCDKLTTVTYPETIDIISGFSNTGVSVVKFAEGATPTQIADRAFANCPNLKTFTIPESVTTIGEKAFESCTSLKTITIPASVINIKDNAFLRSGLESIKLPETVTEYGSSIFQYCDKLAQIEFPQNMTVIPYCILIGCSNLKQVNLPNNVVTIDAGAFNSCQSLEKIDLPETLTEIKQEAFLNCRKLTQISIPQNVTTIGNYAFESSGLADIEIPIGITSIGQRAFDTYNSLNSIVWNPSTPFPDNNEFAHAKYLFMPESGTVTNKNCADHIFYGGVTDSLHIDESTRYSNPSFTLPRALKAKKVAYERDFNATSGYGEAAGWQTIVLPFDVTEISFKRGYGEDAEIIPLAPFGNQALETAGTLPFWLYELGTDGNYKAATAIKANHPYLICMPNNDKYPSSSNIYGEVKFANNNEAGVSLVATEGALKPSVGTKFNLVPTYDRVMMSENVYALNVHNWYQSDEKQYAPGSVFVRNYNDGGYTDDPAVYPFRAYLTTNEGQTATSTSAPMLYSIGGGDGTITGIEDVPFATPDKATKAYSRDGVLYINTDADRTIRIYDVTGRTVRIIEAREGVNEVHGLDSGIYLLEGQKVAVGR